MKLSVLFNSLRIPKKSLSQILSLNLKVSGNS